MQTPERTTFSTVIIAETITFYDDLYEFLSAAPISRYIFAFFLAYTRKLSLPPSLSLSLSADFLCRPSLQAVPNARDRRESVEEAH